MATNRSEGASPSARDDRTLRAIEAMLGDREEAAVALTHFATAVVEVVTTSATWSTPSGRLATTVALNMLTRFAARVRVRMIGHLSSVDAAAFDRDIARVRCIDARPGHSIHVIRAECEMSVDAATLWLGDGIETELARRVDAEELVAVGADAWTCVLTRGKLAGPIESTDVPFGVLTGVCFGVAEVFKTLLAQAAPAEARAAIRRRFVRDWRYSAWRADRITLADSTAPSALPALTLSGVTLVGAGAVGNFVALGLSTTPAVCGTIETFDHKLVDEKNLNRCFYFTEADVAMRKVAVVACAASRDGLRFVAHHGEFSIADAAAADVIVSAVDNNLVRHRIQEALPKSIIEGSTSSTTVTVATHSGVDERTCLVCRHPDPESGMERVRPLTVEETAAATGLGVEVISTSLIDEGTGVTDALLARVRRSSPIAAGVLQRERDAGADLCGALGALRQELGTREVPQEASVPFVSGFAGIQVAAEITKTALRSAGHADVPVLDNEISLDLGRDYSRHQGLSGANPARSDCAFCQNRREQACRVYSSRWDVPSRRSP